MPIQFQCPNCQKSFVVRNELAGKTATCKNCSAKITIPQPVRQQQARASAPPKAPLKPKQPNENPFAFLHDQSDSMQTVNAPTKSTPFEKPSVEAPPTRKKAARWKIPVGVFVLLIGDGFLMLFVYLNWVFVQPRDEPHISTLAIISTAIVLLGWPFFKGGTVAKVIFMLLFGILPGYVVIKGWEAIEEGRQPALNKTH